jgi:hypothetical protein
MRKHSTRTQVRVGHLAEDAAEAFEELADVVLSCVRQEVGQIELLVSGGRRG